VEQDAKMTAYSTPNEMTGFSATKGFSATDDAAKRNTDNSSGFPIYSFGRLTKQSAKEWIIEFGGDEKDIARNNNKVAEAFGEKVVFKGIKLHMLVVKATLTELKLVLKGYKPGEIKCVEQDAKMTAYSPPDEMSGFSATDGAVKRETDNCLGFPIYSFGIFTTQSAKQWIIEFGGDEKDIAHNKNEVAETLGDKVVFKGIKLHILVVKATLTELKLVLKGYKPDEIKFSEQDAKMRAFSPPQDTPPGPELFKSRLGDQDNPPWHLNRIEQRDLPTDEGFLAKANSKNGKGVKVPTLENQKQLHQSLGLQQPPAEHTVWPKLATERQ